MKAGSVTRAFAVLAAALLLTVFASGCLAPLSDTGAQVRSQDEAAQAVSNISGDIEDISSKLNDLEKLFE
jgi:outer membrane lipoprotein-sorting protein